MSNGKRSMGLFGVSGVLVATLIIAAFVAMGGIFQAKGKLTIEITDAPAEIDQLWLTIDEIKIQGDTGWETLTLNFDEGKDTVSFDLLTLQDAVKTVTDVSSIPVGKYSMIQIHVETAVAQLSNGTSLPVTVPSDTIKVLLQPKLTVSEGQETVVLIDLQPEDVHAIENSHTVNIRPTVKSVIENSIE